MIDSQIVNVQNTSDVICNWIIQVLSYASKYYGISYGELNMLLLSIGILIIFMYSVGTIFNLKFLLYTALVLTITTFLGTIFLLLIVPLPNIF